MTNIHNLGMTNTEYAKLLIQSYDPNLEHQLIELGESVRPSQEASANSGTDTRQSTTDGRGVGRIYGSLGGSVLLESERAAP